MHKIISLTIVVLLAGANGFFAQTPIIQSPVGGDLPEWSSDSQLFVYQNTGKNFPDVTQTPSEIFMAAPYWEAFNPQTGDLVESNVWPLYPNLSSAERRVFQTEGFLRSSPDGEIFVYPSLNEKLTIANRTTQQVFETDIDYPALNILSIWWSEDSQGVAVSGAGISPYEVDPIVYYIRLSNRSDLTQTQIFLVHGPAPMVVTNRVFRPVELERILDVHQHQVLTTMSDLSNWGKAELSVQDAQSYLVIWNPENPENSVIIDAFDGGSIRAAAFVPNDSQRLLVILGNENIGVSQFSTVQSGLYTYDIQARTLQFLTPLGEYYPDDPFFSPDGNWLAVVVKATGKYAFFRTSDLRAIPPLVAPTAFPTFTPVPTYTATDLLTTTHRF